MNDNFSKTFYTAVFGLLLLPAALFLAPGQATIEDAERTHLVPETEHHYASRLATRFINGYHYHRSDIDDDLSERMFDQYLGLLDGNRLYFLASDIEEIEQYRDYLHEAIRSADLDPAFEIFNRYVERVDERTRFALSLLEGGFEFDIDEDYHFDRSEQPWAQSREELEEVWRQRVKNDWLLLKLADQDDEEIAETLETRYTNLKRRVSEFESQDVFQFFMNAYTRSIEPHSAYMSPRSVDNFEISMRLSLDGIGAMLQRETDYTTIMEIVPGGPADLDGRLQPGDRIVGVAQDEEEMVDVIGWRLDDVVSLIRGERETIVRLEVLPADTGLSGPSKEIEIERNEVKLEEQAASSDIIEVPGSDGERRIGVLRVPVFYVDFEGRARNEPNYRSSTRDVRRLINELKEEGVDGIVVDLRGNGGGALIEATTMTGLFIDEGPVVQVRDSRGQVKLERDNEPGMAWDGPLGVLVDRRSASASEIFAAAIQDYGRGVILGENTFGKGTVQNLINLDEFSQSDDSRLGQIKLTMAQFYRIDGGSTQARGVIPDIALPTAGDPEDVGESALEFALPWGEIDSTDYAPVADLSDLIAVARESHQARLGEDEELRKLIEYLEDIEARSDRKSVSLEEGKRRAEVEAAEERRQASLGAGGLHSDGLVEDPSAAPDNGSNGSEDGSEENGEEENGSDLYLLESARILVDLIHADREEHLLAHRDDLRNHRPIE